MNLIRSALNYIESSFFLKLLLELLCLVGYYYVCMYVCMLAFIHFSFPSVY
jgi:hypothetical protein